MQRDGRFVSGVKHRIVGRNGEKDKFYRSVVWRPTMLYGSESWVKNEQILSVAERRMLGWTSGVIREDGA